MRIRTVHDLASLVRGRRLDAGWAQGELAARAGVSRKWVSDLERAKASVELAGVLRVLDALGIDLASADADTHTEARAPAAAGTTVDLDAHLADYLGR